MTLFSISCRLAATITVVAALGARKTAPRRLTSEEQQHASSQRARLTLLDGESRTVLLEGVGCPTSMCSRVSVDSKAAGDSVVTKTWLDSLTAIKDVSKADALFVFRDGSERRLSVIPLNRVLYIKGKLAGDEKVDLASIRSIEFILLGSK